MRENIAYPPFIKDPTKLNKFYENVSACCLVSCQIFRVIQSTCVYCDLLSRLMSVYLNFCKTS